VAVEIVVTGSYNDKDIKRAMRDLNKMSDEAGNASKTVSEHFASLSRGMETVGRNLTAGVTLPIIGAGVIAAKWASDAEESANKVNVVFGEQAKQIQEWAKGSERSFGLSEGEANNFFGSLGTMLKGFGMDMKDVPRMSQALLTLGSDLGSFHNKDTAQVMDMISSAFRGEYDSIQQLIPTMSAATVQQKALAMTGKSSADALTDQEKALATYQLLLEGAGPATGDFARTQAGAANSSRIAMAEIRSAGESIGAVFLPMVSKAAQFLAELGAKFQSLSPAQQEFIVKALAIAAAIGPVLIVGAKLISAFQALKPLILGVKAATLGLNAAMLANPIGLIVIGVVALVAALVIAYKKIDWFREFVDKAFRLIADYVSFMWNNVWKPIFTKIGEIVKMVWQNVLKPAFVEIAKFFVTEIQPRLEALRRKFQEVWPKIQLYVQAAWIVMQPILEKVIKFIGQYLVQHLRTMFMVLKAVFAGIETTISTWWPVVSAVFNAVVAVIANVIVPTVRTMWSVWSQVFSAIGTVVSTVFGAVSAVINTVVVPAFNFLVGVVRGVWAGISGAIGGAWGYIAGVFGAIKGGIEGVASFFAGAAGRIGGVFWGIGDTIRNAFSSAFNAVRDLWNRTLGGRGFSIPGWVPGIGGRDFRFPSFAKGGVVPGIPGTPIPAILHAGEMVLRRQQVDNFATAPAASSSAQYAITVNVAPGANPVDTGRAIVDAIKAYERSNSASWRGAA
jgi:phage-related protein